MPLVLDPIQSGYNLSKINDNFEKIQETWDEKLDRVNSGSFYNQMDQALDMNSNEIINTKVSDDPTSLVTKEYVDALFNAIDGAEGVIPLLEPRQQGDGVTTLFNSPATEQAPAASFFVQIDGITQRPITDFNATSLGKIVFTEAPPLFSDIDITYFEPASLGDVVTLEQLPELTNLVFDSVAEMIASASSGNNCKTPYNDWVHNGGTSGTISDFDVKDALNIADFAGTVNDTASFKEAVSYANANNKNITGSSDRKITLTGSDTIVIEGSFELNKAEIDVQNFSGILEFVGKEEVITYLPGSSVVDNLLVEPTLEGNKFEGWDGLEEVSDAFVVLESSQPFYTYRNVEKNRIEFNKSIAFGILESNLKYPLESSTITSVRVQKMASQVKRIGDFSINLGNRDVGTTLIKLSNATMVRMDSIRFKLGEDVLSLTNPQLVQLNYCCNLDMDDVYFQRPIVTSAGTGFAYNLAMANSYGLTLRKLKGFGDGWGATGNNSCQKIKFYDCTLSRIDFHEPFRESLDVNNCVIGSWGILVSALGDLTVDGSRFIVNSDNTHINNDGIIRTRADTGGFCDGKLVVRNSVVETDKGIAMFQHTASSGNPKPAGSPIGYIAWNSIKYQNITSRRGNIVSMAPIVNGTYGIEYPYQVIVDNCNVGLFAYSIDLSNQNPVGGGITDGTVMLGDYNHKIDLTNTILIRSSDTKIVDQTADNFRILINISDCEGGRGAKELVFTLKCNADVNITKSVISEFNLIDSGTNTKPLNVCISDCRWNFRNVRYSEPLRGFSSNRSPSNLARFIVNNSYLYHSSLVDSKAFGAARLNNCLVWNGSIYSSYIDYGSIVANEIAFGSEQDTANSFDLLYNGNQVYSFDMVGISEFKFIQLSDTESVRFVRAASNKLTFTTIEGTPTLDSLRLH